MTPLETPRMTAEAVCPECGHDVAVHEQFTNLNCVAVVGDNGVCPCVWSQRGIYRHALAASQQEVERLTTECKTLRLACDARNNEITDLSVERDEARDALAAAEKGWLEASAALADYEVVKEMLAASQQEVERLNTQVADVLRGQESLKRQTVRIRRALGGGEDGQDTEELARVVTAQLAAARKDSARLDWLSTNEAAYSLNIGGRVWVFAEEGPNCDGDTLREALDAARRGTE